MAIKGLKVKQDNLEIQGTYGMPESGDALNRPVVNGRSPQSKNISVSTLRVDHHRKDLTSNKSTTDTSPERGVVNQGPNNGESLGSPVKKSPAGVGTGPKFK